MKVEFRSIRQYLLIVITMMWGINVHAKALTPEEVDAKYQSFLAGTIELDGNIFSPSTKEKESFNVLWKTKQWEELARTIIKAKPYHSDLIWFYLGEAASGLGNDKVAKSYYSKVLVESNLTDGNAHCNSVKLFGKDYCYGFNFPADAEAKLGAGAQPAASAPAAVAATKSTQPSSQSQSSATSSPRPAMNAADEVMEIATVGYVVAAFQRCGWPLSKEQNHAIAVYLDTATYSDRGSDMQIMQKSQAIGEQKSLIEKRGTLDFCGDDQERKKYDKRAAQIYPIGKFAAPLSK